MPELRVRRDDLAECELAAGEPLREDLAEGEAQLLVERFALSANNITYAATGDQLGYWRLFPASGGWGRIPAWGYARVVGSKSPAADVEQRVSGLVPMGTYVTVQPAQHPNGFVDAAPHRAELSPVYNQYITIAGEADDAMLVLRPLFATSILLDLALADGGLAGAGTVVITSASSKTAYGLAHLLGERQVETIGLTSTAHRGWVEDLGLYEGVFTYDDFGGMHVPGGAVLVDFTGDRRILHAVHEQLGGELRRSIMVGFTHWQAGFDQAPPPGPVPELFFAPDEIARRGAELGERFPSAWTGFAPVVARTMRIEHITGGDALVRIYRELLSGRADPAAGYVASL
jgi:hypothetical protein